MGRCSFFALLQFFAAQAGFGTPVFIVLCIIVMWTYGTRERWKDEGLSAYSVFNEGQTRLLGDRSATQIDNELRGGASVLERERSGQSRTAQMFTGSGHVLSSS